VPRFLTSAWVDAFNQAVESVTLHTPGADAGLVPQSGSFTVAQEVGGAPDGDVTLLLRFDDGKLKLALARGADENGEMGAQPEPNVTIALSYEVAAELAKGELSPADALTAGRIRVRGDLAVLIAGQELMAEARRHTGSLAAETTY
jgi:putative sterol carrier protein